MNTHTLILTLLAAASLGGASAYAQSTPNPSPSGSPIMNWDCVNQSQNTELYGFCGKKASVLEKVAGLPTEIVKRRVFIQITQGSSGGEVKLYERQKDGKFTVTTWDTKETSPLLSDIDRSMFDNKGVNCVGEQVTTVLREKLKEEGTVTHDVAPPATPAAAFSHSIKDAKGDFVRTEVVALC